MPFLSLSAFAGGATEFCLSGELDLGTRYQGMAPRSGETYPTTWCVLSESDSQRVLFSARGKSNPDMDGDWMVAFLPPDMVRIVNRDAPPDVEFRGVENMRDARRIRRLDPTRLLEELHESPDDLKEMSVVVDDDQIVSVSAMADFPLRGRVPVVWKWDWSHPRQPAAKLFIDGQLLFDATGSWREVGADEAAAAWQATSGAEPVAVPGDRWPARVNMQRIDLAENLHLVRGVRTGFQHLVVETSEGLVIADAPAGWLELHYLPPTDMVPGLGVSGLSEQFVDFLKTEFPDQPVRAVALTHFHDDHAGGARAFAAAGAEVYAPVEIAEFLENAMNRESMPADRLSAKNDRIHVQPVDRIVTIGSEPNRVQFVPMGESPHADAMLGVLALDKNYFFVSDIHVPRSDADAPASHRVVTECWFATWATGNLSPDVHVINSHSPIETPLSRLDAYLDSEAC